MDCHVKENYMHSRERVTAFTLMSSSNAASPPLPEFVFKGKGQRVKLDPPSGVKFQWSDSGPYRVAHVMQMVKNLPTFVGPLETMMPGGKKKFRIFTLDDYSAHLDPSIAEELFRKGYILVIIGGGITGDMQPNDTALHHRLKEIYREKEQEVLITQLRNNQEKIPTLSRDNIMTVMADTWKECDVDQEMAFKLNWLSNSLDGSKDHLVSSRIMDLVGEEFKEFRAELLSSDQPSSMRKLIDTITPPEGVVRKDRDTPRDLNYIPDDEGMELFDGNGSILRVFAKMQVMTVMMSNLQHRNLHHQHFHHQRNVYLPL